MNYQQLRANFLAQRPGEMELQEWEHLFYTVVQEYTGMGRFELVQALQQSPDSDQLIRLKEAFSRLQDQEPLQYVLGYTHFLDLRYLVGPGVLIPRPETEEWVREVIQLELKNSKEAQLDILEIGTGSGCIALSLAHYLEHSSVTAVDVSSEALKIARQNAEDLNLDCHFIQLDFLKDTPGGTFDILVSNPPYVRRLEAARMRPNVLEHEPDLALFVPDDDPLLFYRHIGKKGQDLLKPEGRIYLEINEYLSEEVLELYVHNGYQNVVIHRDMFDKPRWISAIKPYEKH